MIKVNAMGDNCPIPVIKTKKAMEGIAGPEVVEVLVDNETAVQNVTKFGKSAGAEVKSEKLGEKEFKVCIEVAGGMAAAQELSADECLPDNRTNTIVVVSSEYMGSGKDDLGKVLMKGFIFALTELTHLPKQILFYNGGAVITSEGSDSLEDLKSMEAQGVEILTCGTCLDYYGLKEKLAVGGITNMYSIVEAMESAGKIIRP